MIRRGILFSFLLLTSLAFIQFASGDNSPAKAKDKPAAPPKPTTIKAESGPLTVVVTMKGIVEAEKSSELAYRPKVWSGNLLVKKAVEHGATVKAGDVLVEFDTEKLDLAIRDAKQERQLAELALQQTESELAILQKQSPLDLEAAVRDDKQSTDDLDQFLKIDKPLQIEVADQQVKNIAFFLETAKDELKQLSKMYKDKDLTDETEEIVLKRYKHNVAQSEFQLKQAQVRNEQTLKIDLPRREQRAKETAQKSEIALIRAKSVSPLTMNLKQLGFAKQKYEDAKSLLKLTDLEKDLAAMKVVAPVDGIAYHGRCVRGQWTHPSGGLTPNSSVTGADVFMTIVSTAELLVRGDVDEKDLSGLKRDMQGKVTLVAFPSQKLAARVTKIATAPLNGKFEIRASLSGEAAGVLPGMTGSVRFITAKKDNAVTVPTAAVFEDDADESKYVYKSAKSSEPEKVAVKVGITVGDKTEILDGLTAGDEILGSKPTPTGGK